MVTTGRREAIDLKQRLYGEPHRFDFFQAVRLLERLACDESASARQPVGADGAPEQECVRFRALPSLSHAPAPVRRLEKEQSESAPEMVVSFLGLTGPGGVLPAHYTELLLRRLRAKDSSLRDLLDVFNHRLVSLFYRAWEKYRLPIAYERSGQSGPEKIGQALRCLVGRGTAGLGKRDGIPEETFLYYAGLFAHQSRSAAGLGQLLGDHLGLPIRVLQFQGQRLRLDDTDRTRLPSRQAPRGLNCRLGVDTVVGDHVWDIQGKFRLRVGPLTHREFQRFFPVGGDLLRPLSQLTRSYVRGEFTFDVQLVLKTGAVPRMRLGGKAEEAAYLGWNTWVAARAVAREADDAVLRPSDHLNSDTGG